MPRISVIIPTINEAGNINQLIPRILSLQEAAVNEMEIIVVDDGSTDGTRDLVRAWETGHPVRLLARDGQRGLAQAVIAGAEIAGGEIVVVMDADFSHDPAVIPSLVKPILTGDYDMAIGSRHIPGASTPYWPIIRRLFSRLVTMFAWPLADVKDPMSGFFAVQRQRLLAVDREASGFKIGLELLAGGAEPMRAIEVPVEFSDRVRGQSKLDHSVVLTGFRRLMALAGGKISVGSGARFGIVGFLGMGIDFGVFSLLTFAGMTPGRAHILSFFPATVFNYLLNARWTFPGHQGRDIHRLPWRQYGSFLIVALMALFLRGGVLAAGIKLLSLPPQAALLAAIVAAAVINYFGSAFFVFPLPGRVLRPEIRWRVVALGVAGYMLLLRLLYLGTAELLPEEAYYWNYSQHLDIGYLDHPPMVAWIIWLGTSISGDTEFAVRLGAYLAWLVTAFFCFRFTCNLYDKSTAFRTILLLAILPFFFGVGFMMTPDSLLVACWAGTLYFLERALIGESKKAWWGVGICIGLGMLSKYTIALLCPAVMLFILADPRSRHWLLRPQPYIAAILAFILFMPVIIWNYQHNWASFIFQGPNRIQGATDFSLPSLIRDILILLTPIGALALYAAFRSNPDAESSPDRGREGLEWRRRIFCALATLVPLVVFITFSLTRNTKLNWTGPLWLAALPLIAWQMIPIKGQRQSRLLNFLHRAWSPTIIILMLFYGTFLHFVVNGIPGLGYSHGASLTSFMGWEDLAQKVSRIENEVMRTTGVEPVIIGMDKYNITSELNFYLKKDAENSSPGKKRVPQTMGRQFFGMDSLMYRYWVSESLQNKLNQENPVLILVGKNLRDLKNEQIASSGWDTGKVEELTVSKNGLPVGKYFYALARRQNNTRLPAVE
jgi:dolichol-phosphate mannosyltransferase